MYTAETKLCVCTVYNIIYTLTHINCYDLQHYILAYYLTTINRYNICHNHRIYEQIINYPFGIQPPIKISCTLQRII